MNVRRLGNCENVHLMGMSQQIRLYSHRLRLAVSRLLGTNYIFTLTTTVKVSATTESWRTATKFRITSLIMYRNVSNFPFGLLFVFICLLFVSSKIL